MAVSMDTAAQQMQTKQSWLRAIEILNEFWIILVMPSKYEQKLLFAISRSLQTDLCMSLLPIDYYTNRRKLY